MHIHTALKVVLCAVLFSTASALADESTQASEPPMLQSVPQQQYMPPQYAPPTGYEAPHRVRFKGGVIPAYAHLETEPSRPFLISGAALFGASYLVSIFYALGTCGAQMACRDGSAALYAPLVGPFITAAEAPTSGGAALAAFDGALQLTGVVLFIMGFALPNKFVVWQDSDARAKLTVAPIVTGRGAGAGVGLTLTNF